MNLVDRVVGLSSPLVEQLEKRVAFSDQSESGYSTTTSSDEGQHLKSKISFQGSIQKQSTCQMHEPKSLDSSFSRLQSKKNNKHSGFDSQAGQYTLNISQTTSSPQTSPVYYDPLHLQNVSPNDQAQFIENQLLSRKKTPARKVIASTNIRGILKANSSATNDVNKLDASNSPTLSHDSATSTPTRPLNSSHSLFPNDPNRASAFTPVKSRRAIVNRGEHPDDISSLNFTPSKGPNIVDYVSSVHSDLDSSDVSSISNLSNDKTVGHFSQLKPEYRKKLFVSESANTITPHHKKLPAPSNATKPIENDRLASFSQDMTLLQSNLIQQSSSSDGQSNFFSQAKKLSSDVLRLRKFLDITSGKELKQHLCNQLDSNNSDMIKALSILIPDTMTRQVESHCSRCHKTFLPDERRRCYLPHPESMVEKINQDEEGADFICHCCNTAFRLFKMNFYEESTNAVLTGHCYSGQHTIDQECVDYRAQGGAAKTCKENGCVEVYV